MGVLRITGVPVCSSCADVRRTKISMVFQHFALLPHRTVIDNVAYGLEVQGLCHAPNGLERARTIHSPSSASTAGQTSLPSEPSGGMKQRVGLDGPSPPTQTCC